MDFPYKAFKLTPTMQVKEVTVVGRMGLGYVDWLELDTGSHIHRDNLHKTVAEAVATGNAALQKQRKHVTTLMAGIEKRETNLRKAKA